MKRLIAITLATLLPLSYAAAEGYQANAQSTKQSAMGHVGAAMKLGAESMHFNPAGLGFLDKRVDVSAGVTGIFTNMEYSNGPYSHKSDNPVSTPLYAYAAFRIYDNLSAGISVTTPYGSSIDWGINWAGSALIQDISLKAFSIQPTISYRLFDRVSVGAGLMVMFGNFSLSRALIPAGGFEDLRALSAYEPSINDIVDKYKDIDPVSATLSGNANTRVGVNLGAMVDITDKWTLGVSYRSRVNMRVPKGNAVMNYVNETEVKNLVETVNPHLVNMGKKPITIPPLDRGTFDAALPLPSNWNVGITLSAKQ